MIKKFLPILVVSMGFGVMLVNIIKDWQLILSVSFNINPGSLTFLLILLSSLYFINVLSWHLVILALGVRVRFIDNLKVWMLSNLVRFIPGGFWQYPSRIYMLSNEGVDKSTTTLAVILEATLNLLSGCIIVGLAIFLINLKIEYQLKVIIFTAVILLSFLLIFNKFLLIAVLKLISKLLRKNINVNRMAINNKFFLLLLPLFGLQFIVGGLILFILTSWVTNISLGMITTFIVIYTTSWLIGYITIIAPSGLGIQEVSIASFLANFTPFSVASIIAISFRVLLYLMESLIILLVMFLIRKKAL